MIVTRGSKQDYEKKLFDVLSKLEKAGYRASGRKLEFFLEQTKWLGHGIDENGNKPNEEKVDASLKLKPPNITKELKSFLGAIQYLAKFPPNLSEKHHRLRRLCKKNETWEWKEDQGSVFDQIK